MTKAAVSLISLEPAITTAQAVAAGNNPHSLRGILAALIYDSLGDLFSQINDSFQPVHLHRAATAQEVIDLTEAADTVLLLGEISAPDHAFQLLMALKLLKPRIETGQVRVIVNCTLASPTLLQKLRAYGCTEIVTGTDQPDEIVQKARMIVELLLFRRAASRLPGGQVTSIGLAFLLSEWISQKGIDYPSMAHLFSACLSAACGGKRVEFFHSSGGSWTCAGTSDSKQSQWISAVEAAAKAAPGADFSGIKIEWIGDKAGALVCDANGGVSAEQARLFQAAAELSRDFILRGAADRVLVSA